MGIIDQIHNDNVKAKIGEKKYKYTLTWLGIIISLLNNFTPSAKGCNIP